jgi:hypothetical protein
MYLAYPSLSSSYLTSQLNSLSPLQKHQRSPTLNIKMYASVLSLALALALAPTVLAATPSNYGGWNVTIEDNNFEYGYRSTHVDVLYIDANTVGGDVSVAGLYCKPTFTTYSIRETDVVHSLRARADRDA